MGEIYKVRQSLWVRCFPFLFSVLFIGAYLFDRDWRTLLVAGLVTSFGVFLLLIKMEYIVRKDEVYLFSLGMNYKWEVPLRLIEKVEYVQNWDAYDGISFETVIKFELKEGVTLHRYAKNVYFFDKLYFYDSGDIKSFEYRVSFVDVECEM